MLFAIGDVHGHFNKLMSLMDHCREFAARKDEPARFVLLGDYIDRGPASNKVLGFLARRPDGVIAIRGNHEELLLDALEGPGATERWLYNGGVETLGSYGVTEAADIPPEHIELMRGLPLFVDDGVRLFVHAGIDPADAEARDARVLLWTRKYPADSAKLPRFIVHGHTPTATGKPDLRPNRLNLDTGAGFGRALTAAAFDEESDLPCAFLSNLGELTMIGRPDGR